MDFWGKKKVLGKYDFKENGEKKFLLGKQKETSNFMVFSK